MDLLQHLVDVDGIRFLALVLALLSVLGDGLGGLAGFLSSLSGVFGGPTPLQVSTTARRQSGACPSSCNVLGKIFV